MSIIYPSEQRYQLHHDETERKQEIQYCNVNKDDSPLNAETATLLEY